MIASGLTWKSGYAKSSRCDSRRIEAAWWGVMQPCRPALVLWFERVRGNGHWRAAYNACGVRIREHPVTKDAIFVGLSEKGQLVIA